MFVEFPRVRRGIHIFAVIVAILFIQGCASTTKWKVDAVEPSRKGVAPSTLSVGTFSSKKRSDGDSFARLLAGKLQDENFIKIKRNGAEGHVQGSLHWGKTKRDTWLDKYTYKDKTYKRYYAKIHKSITLSYELDVNGQTYTATYEKSYTDKNSSTDSYSKAKAELASEEAIRAHLMQLAAYEIVRDITPYRVLKTYKIKLGDTDKLELGADYLKIGRRDQAMEIFRQIANKTQNDEDRAAAVYNQGIIHEANGDLEQAFKAYRDASQLHLEELMYPKAITRLENELKKREKLDQQMKALNK